MISVVDGFRPQKTPRQPCHVCTLGGVWKMLLCTRKILVRNITHSTGTFVLTVGAERYQPEL